VRFLFGLGAVTTNLNDGYPWGIWVVVDVVIGSAFACGGFSVAMLVYIFNKGQYHPLVRPALLASLFGYTLAGAGVIFDLGRWWNFWHIFWPGYAQSQFGDVRGGGLHLGLHRGDVDRVLAGLPREVGQDEARQKLNKVLFFFIALGVRAADDAPVLARHAAGGDGRADPPALAVRQLLPLLYLLTAITASATRW
jgi:Ni/Fe-hydrogenase subunit HybB-like protein